MSNSAHHPLGGEEHAEQGHRPSRYAIVVNARPVELGHALVTYEQITTLAFPVPPAADTLYSVVFRKAKHPREGSLAPGASVEVKMKGTVFNVTPTGKS